jgi:hypothetical protein
MDRKYRIDFIREIAQLALGNCKLPFEGNIAVSLIVLTRITIRAKHTIQYDRCFRVEYFVGTSERSSPGESGQLSLPLI